MVQRRNNGTKPNQPGKTPSGSGFNTRKERRLSTFSLQIILMTKGAIYFKRREGLGTPPLLKYRVPHLHTLHSYK